MAKKIGQMRYYGDKATNNNQKNFPSNISRQTLSTGTIFENIFPITQLGIQTLPGMIIYINNNVDPVVVGQTGIYELNIEGGSSIYALAFDYKMLTMINESPSAYLIIDYISEAGG